MQTTKSSASDEKINRFGGITMRKIFLQPHDIYYAEKMASLISNPAVREPLGLTINETTVASMLNFIREMQLEEMMGNHLSRMIMNEDFELIGVITLHNINENNQSCHISTWIAEDYWGLGYNTIAKEKILYYAFTEMNLKTVFAGARVENFRSIKAQRKLPYMMIHAEQYYPEELKILERREQAYCILNAIEAEEFFNWHERKIAN